MGYWSELEPCTFLSNLNKEELDRKVKSFLSHINKEELDWYFYNFDPIGKEKELYEYNVSPSGTDYPDRQYADKLLARVISSIIAPGEKTRLQFTGVDGDGHVWGWAIEKDNIFPTALYVILDPNKPVISLEKWLNKE